MMKRSGFLVMIRLIGLVKPLSGYMILAVVMGLIGHLCATFITVFGGFALQKVLYPEWPVSLGVIFTVVFVFAIVILCYRMQDHTQPTPKARGG